MYIYSHNEGSAGASALSKALKALRIKHEGSAFRGNPTKVVINWGSSILPEAIKNCRVLNSEEAVSRSSDKLRFFRHIEGGPRIPDYTNNAETAKQWVRDGNTVLARAILRGHSGNGIHFMDQSDPNSFRAAPLYTKYIKKKDEFRIHFCNGQIIDVQRKALRPDFHPDHVEWRVRNLANGFIFVRNNVTVPADVTRQAELCIERCGLDFGAIDLIYNEKSAQAYVLEVNTAPGLVGTTVENYANAFRNYEK